VNTDIYIPALNCFLPGSWDGRKFPVWGFRYSPLFARVLVCDGPRQRDKVLEAFNCQARKLDLKFEAIPEDERVIVYPNRYIPLKEFVDQGCNLAFWVDRFLEAMVSLWPKQALVEFGVDSIAVSPTGIPFYLDWSLAIVGPAVRKEFPSPRHYRLFLCQFRRLCHEA
jgi:hypothetical protein